MSKCQLVLSTLMLVSLTGLGEISFAYIQQEAKSPSISSSEIQVARKRRIGTGAQIRNPKNIDALSHLKGRIYAPIPKHGKGGWDTKMDLNDATAQTILNRGIPFGNRVYAVYKNKFYRFDFENRMDKSGKGFFHGIPIPINQVPSKVQKLIKNIKD